MPEIEIRPADLQDFGQLLALDHSYQTSYVWQMDRTFEEGQISLFFREIRLPRNVKVDYPHSPKFLTQTLPQATLLVAILDNQPVGYVSVVEHLAPNSSWVTDLVVDEKSRRKGIGTALLMTAQEWTVRKSLKRIILEMQSKNFPAIRFAQKLGYEFCGYNDHYYSNRDIALFFARLLH
jgi:ribosomal protein S18 acetylase RimI-like enzyme